MRVARRREGREEFVIEREEIIGKAILDAAFKVHSALGPGLLESVYEAALAYELIKTGHSVERQKPIAVVYDGQKLDVGFRADLIVDGLVLAELKSVDGVTAVFKKTTTTYLRLIPLRLGFLINFNEALLKNGITRITNGLEGKDFLLDTSRASRPSRDTDFRI
jgi:GxxExxY protein